jgi:hypothetical protein
MNKAELDAILAPFLQATSHLSTIASKQNPTVSQGPGPTSTSTPAPAPAASQNPLPGTLGAQLTNSLMGQVKTFGTSLSNLLDITAVKIVPSFSADAKARLQAQGLGVSSFTDQFAQLGKSVGMITGEILTTYFTVLATFDALKLVGKEILNLFKKSFEEVSNFQLKSLAANISPIEVFGKSMVIQGDALIQFRNDLKSTAVEFQNELLKFRDVGISKLDTGTAKLVDKMLFTGQKVGSLATFLSTNAAAVGMNTDQAASLALQLDLVANKFEIQQDTLLEVTQSIKEFSVKMAAIAPGLGGNIEKLMGTLVPQFGLQLGDSVKSMLSLFDPKNLVLITQIGLQDVYEKIRAGTATSEDLKLASRKLVEFADRQLATGQDLTGDFVKDKFLQIFGISDQALVAARVLSDAVIKEGEGANESVVNSFKSIKELVNSVKNKMQEFAISFGAAISDSGGVEFAKTFVNKASDYIKNLAKSLVGKLETEVNAAGDIINLPIPSTTGIDIDKTDAQKFIKFLKDAGIGKSSLEEMREKNMRMFNPEARSEYQSAQLAQLNEIKQNLQEANALKRKDLTRRTLLAPYDMTPA